MLLKPAEIDVNSLDGIKNWLVPVLLTVEPAGIIAVWIKWDRFELIGRRWADGDSVSIVVLRIFPPENDCWGFMEWKSSSFRVVDLSGQWTCCFFSEFVREKVRVILFSDGRPTSSWPDCV